MTNTEHFKRRSMEFFLKFIRVLHISERRDENSMKYMGMSSPLPQANNDRA